MKTEDKFTKSRPECPNPEYWHSEDASSTEIEVSKLVASFVVALQPEYVIETGSGSGQTSEAIGKALLENGHGRLTTLEVLSPKAEMTKSRCAGLPVEVIQSNSLDFTPSQYIDFAWFDSKIFNRVSEFVQYMPYMSSRAVVGFHDTGSQHVLREYMKEIIDEGLLVSPIFLPTPRGVCFGRVKGGIGI